MGIPFIKEWSQLASLWVNETNWLNNSCTLHNIFQPEMEINTINSHKDKSKKVQSEMSKKNPNKRQFANTSLRYKFNLSKPSTTLLSYLKSLFHTTNSHKKSASQNSSLNTELIQSNPPNSTSSLFMTSQDSYEKDDTLIDIDETEVEPREENSIHYPIIPYKKSTCIVQLNHL